MDLVVALTLGLVISFIGSIPIAGPLAVLIVDRAVSGRRVEGLFIALGGALAEALYAFGVALLFPMLLGLSDTIVFVSRIAGATLVTCAGILLCIRPDFVRRTGGTRRRGSFVTGLALSGLNPTLIATWTVVVATLNSHGLLGRSAGAAVAFGLGVGAGVTGWFALLVSLSHAAKDFFDGPRRKQTIRVLGLVLVCAGGYLVFHTVHAASKA